MEFAAVELARRWPGDARGLLEKQVQSHSERKMDDVCVEGGRGLRDLIQGEMKSILSRMRARTRRRQLRF